MEKTYLGWAERKVHSRQNEYTEGTPLLSGEGHLLARGWARRNVFDYDRDRVKHPLRRKEWDFYQISDGKLMLQLSFANISLGGYASLVLVDLHSGETLVSSMAPFLDGRKRYLLPKRGDVPNDVHFRIGKASFDAHTGDLLRTLRFENGNVSCRAEMDILPEQENITTVLPFDGRPDCYFMTTKQNCMPCEAEIRCGENTWTLRRAQSFCVLDWGRVCTPYSLVWYWGNGSGRVTDAKGKEHLFGFEITWGIGSEDDATETCLFWDGKAHKIAGVDVESFPKPDRYMEPWRFTSEDERFCLTMEPFYDHHTDLNIGVMRMHSHQVHGLWSGTVTLDDGETVEIRDFYAFCEYVENRW